MKIVYVAPANSVHILRWANAMSECGHKVIIVSCANHIACEGYNKNVEIIILKKNAPLGYFLNAIELKKVIAQLEPDVVNIHYASGYGTLARMARLKHSLLNVWGSDVYEFPYTNWFNRMIIRANLRYFDSVASTSNCMARQAEKVSGRGGYYITPFGVDTDKFYPMNISKHSDKFLFGTVKSLDKKYGIEDTIKAFAQLNKRLIEEQHLYANKIYYDIYGKGNQKQELEDLIAELQLGDRVRLRGFVPNNELPGIINTFDVFCCNSVANESFGVAAVEAMACGIPVIASNAEGFMEVMENNKTGLVVERGNIDGIEKAMYEMLLLNEDERKQYGKNGRERVVKNYSWKDNVVYMESIYNEMLKNKRK